jgi:phosphoglycolate phosphatase-like HAD superfamily hydrolase
MNLLLFDVDGTIVRLGSALSKLHVRAFNYGFRKAYGVDANMEEITDRSHGSTDRSIVCEVLRQRGFKEDAISKGLERCFSYMVDYFRDNISGIGCDGVLIDGVTEALNVLAKDRSCVLGLLTGNLQEIAEMKLRKLGIYEYFKVGGFGGVSEIRSDLIGLAIEDGQRKGLIGKHIGSREVYVIGDTRKDIKCAQERGAVSVAVATGRATKATLREYKPDYLLDSLHELPGIFH